jgi:hypothetical protein
MSESTGWPGGEFADGEAYSHHANVKLTQEQLDYINNSGEPISQWIRGAVQERMDTEAHYKRANERHYGTTNDDTT